MSYLASAPARLSQRFIASRARRQALPADRPFRTSRGEIFAIGLGCDGWKPRQY
jgi:hypothetical protein